MVEAVDEAETSMYMNLSTKALIKKRIGESMSVRIMKKTMESSGLTLRRLT